ncbi:winged helix-turn-helix transcriptional regulator [Candidatus Bathyarchaeota archaeon]|nr:winged helix-turn-helix transcriptional regulator [Candidatus Bathyarchaeota archaeon]
MKRSQILSVTLLVVIFAFSFLTVACSERNSAFSPTIPTAPLLVGATFRDNSASLNQSTRIEIYNFIITNPGTHFRAICNYLNLPIGVAQYHLSLLTKAGLLSVFRDGRYKRYFESKRFTETEMTAISFLRHETARKILLILLEKQTMPHKNLSRRLEISSQALTWQMNRLRETGLIESARDGMKVKYSLQEASVTAIRRCVDLIGRR